MGSGMQPTSAGQRQPSSGHFLPSDSPFSSALNLSFGDITISTVVPRSMRITLPGEVQAFLVDATDPDISLKLKWADAIEPLHGKELLFDSGQIWRLYRHEHSLCFDLSTVALGREPYKRVVMDLQFTRGEIFVNRKYFDKKPLYPLEYPLDEILIVHKLAATGGAEVHGCGIVAENGKGILFVGHSGAGKSTTARLWHAHRKVKILSDDRIVLRQQNGSIRMFGTPWHGEAGYSDASSAPLHAIYLLEHGSKNELQPIRPARAAAELFARCFLPFHDGQALESTMALLARVTDMVPCQWFRFVPDVTCLECISA